MADKKTVHRGTRDQPGTRIVLRVPKSVYACLSKAAAYAGLPLAVFVLRAALRTADASSNTESLIVPSARDARRMVDLLRNPPPPNRRLRAALKRHANLLGGDS
jgi:uncharacterized protein (DUF1778 family)